MTALRDWFHFVVDVPERGLSESRDATGEECIELARELDILSCDHLAVSYRIEAAGAGRYTFSGNVEADVAQACVVTLEPVPAHISEAFSVELVPASDLEDEPIVFGDREVSSVPDVEPIEKGRIAAGAIVFGVLSAALPPYPRKDGAAFDWVDPKADPAEEDAENPFAALTKLKPPQS